MNVIAFSSIKGGVGKSSHAILIANCLAAAGYKVLVIDMDLNNSITFFYSTKELEKEQQSKNIAAALTRSDNKLPDFVCKTKNHNIDIIPSSIYLLDLRGISERRLAQLMPSLEAAYDVVIIDTQPTYDNIVLAAYNAADIIITPVNLSTFDYNTAVFLSDKLHLETDKYSNWYLTVNGFNHRFVQASGGDQKEYAELFTRQFQMTDFSCWFPWTPFVRKVTDRHVTLTKKKNNSLYDTVCNLSECFIDGALVRPEAF